MKADREATTLQGGSIIFDEKFECELDVKELSKTSKTPATPSLASNDTTITRKVTNISRFASTRRWPEGCFRSVCDQRRPSRWPQKVERSVLRAKMSTEMALAPSY